MNEVTWCRNNTLYIKYIIKVVGEFIEPFSFWLSFGVYSVIFGIYFGKWNNLIKAFDTILIIFKITIKYILSIGGVINL